jgi:hypothetical protein
MKVTICTLCLSHWLGLCRFFDFHRKPRLNSEFTAQRNVRRGREFSSKMLTRICASHCSVVVRPMPDRSSIADATLPSKTPVFGRSIGRMYRTRRSAHGRKRPHLRTSAHSSTCSAGASEAGWASDEPNGMSSGEFPETTEGNVPNHPAITIAPQTGLRSICIK